MNFPVNWSTSVWTSTDFDKVSEDIEDICHPKSPGLILMSNPQNHEEAGLTCRAFNSNYGLCRSQHDETLMRSVFLRSSTEGDRCGVGDNYRYWCGFTDLGREDVWTDVNWRNQLSYYREDHPWNRGEPNGGTFENCAENEIR